MFKCCPNEYKITLSPKFLPAPLQQPSHPALQVMPNLTSFCVVKDPAEIVEERCAKKMTPRYRLTWIAGVAKMTHLWRIIGSVHGGSSPSTRSGLKIPASRATTGRECGGLLPSTHPVGGRSYASERLAEEVDILTHLTQAWLRI